MKKKKTNKQKQKLISDKTCISSQLFTVSASKEPTYALHRSQLKTLPANAFGQFVQTLITVSNRITHIICLALLSPPHLFPH